MGVLSALPLIGPAGNACCCLWVLSGGLIAAYVLQQNTAIAITPGDGVLVGLLAGLIGAVVHTAISIPLADLRRRLRELPRDKEVVAYCRGPYCAFAHKAVRVLKQAGFRVRRLEDGLPEWKAAGLPVVGLGQGRS